MSQTSLKDWLNAQEVNSDSGSTQKQVVQASSHGDTKTERIDLRDTASSQASISLSKDDAPSIATEKAVVVVPLRASQLPENVAIEACSERHIPAFRRLHALLFPIPYQDSYYQEILHDSVTASITRIALWHHDSAVPTKDSSSVSVNGRLVAAIRCRLLACPPHDPSEHSPTLYISTIATLSPYRQHAIASHLLSAVIESAFYSHQVTSVAAHVWEASEDALKWYLNRGFKVVGREETYYRRLAPQTAAWIVGRTVSPTDIIH